MADVLIRPARSEEHRAISALALRSKAHWGYSAEFLESCRAELTYDAATCGSGRMTVATHGARLAGFSLVEGEPPSGELAALFVDPEVIGTGCGRRLLVHTLERARRQGSPSGSIPGRSCPVWSEGWAPAPLTRGARGPGTSSEVAAGAIGTDDVHGGRHPAWPPGQPGRMTPAGRSAGPQPETRASSSSRPGRSSGSTTRPERTK
ncbi:GNAT family N-acetyltransferase [Nocardioides sp.]|uniref:GNAT family N-acetyltransferase n=1 Tax=Nocardioides sp. TaxID=35761 RepID=UPI003529CD16